MSQANEKRNVFFYHANAVALGGVIFRPTPEIIEAQAQANLPVSGGYGSSRVGPFRHREFASFDSAYSFVSGSESKDRTHFNSLATTVIENFQMLRVLSAHRVVARVSSMHPNNPDAEPEITVVGSHFEGLKISGVDVKFDAVKAFDGHRTFEGFREELCLPERNGYMLASLIENVSCAAPGVEQVDGHTLHIKQFGLIHIGEVLITRQSRRVIMLRLEMGCPLESNCSVGVAEGDGSIP